jgi:DNA-binding NtrC family response regulator
MARILCVEDDPSMLMVLAQILTRAGHESVRVSDAGAALHALRANDIDLVLADFQLPGIDGIELVRMMRADRDNTPVFMLTGFGSIDNAMEAIRAGASDYLVKPIEADQLLHRLGQALERLRLERELSDLRRQVSLQHASRRVLGDSPAIERVLESVDAAARSRATVLLEGESGTGKEVIAREIHELSDRRARPFIKLNCAALPEGLIESALFGHEKGAFTGAVRRVEGAFERAHGGTLLLDEISEMRVDLQAKLLRVLQEREFDRVGGTAPISVDVRVIATTNRDLFAETGAGRFRLDLYYRLNVVSIRVPPLRDRASDIPLLVYHFLHRAAQESGKIVDAVSPEAMQLLQAHAWPGNVRELQHAVERAIVLATGSVLNANDFDAIERQDARARERSIPLVVSPQDTPSAISLPSLNLADAEESLIAEALRSTNNNRTHAAALLGIGVRTLRKKLNAPSEAGTGS